ncbi:MAG TPA: tetratricopeptide repeat protein [Candidatus Dormibacteraeota bacterium]|nr:tetratricopeptide repeat protein [Candidatus Dormibacteraeota bacterium]
MPAAREDAEPELPAASPGWEPFPRGELLLACALALILRLLYLAGAVKSPLFAHASLAAHAVHVPRLIQALLDVASVFLLGAAAHVMWGRRAGILTAEIAALYGPLLYFQAEPLPVTPGFFLIALFFYLAARADRSGSNARRVAAGVLLALATFLALRWNGAGAGVEHSPLRFLENLILAWNRREVPCGVDQRFLAAHNSPMFRQPLLLSFAFVGPIALVVAWKERRRAPLLGSYLSFVTLAIASIGVCDRTRLPLLAGALPLAGRGIDRLLAALARESEGIRTSPAAALGELARVHARTLVALGCAVLLVTAPFPGIQRTKSGEGWAALGRAYEESGDEVQSLRAYAEAERQGLRSADTYASWGTLEQRLRLGGEAEKHLLLAVGLDPGNAAAHLALADVYLDRGTLAQAAQEYEVSAGLVPARAAELYVQAGEAYEEARDLDRAASMFRRALDKRPGYEPARRGLERVRKGSPPEPPVKMFPPLAR